MEEFFAFDLSQVIPDSTDPLPDFVGYIDKQELTLALLPAAVDMCRNTPKWNRSSVPINSN